MKKKSEAANTVNLLFHRNGVPTKMIMDGSKEQTKGRFCKKFLEASVHCKQTEPYSSWQNAAEGGIWELKKASGRKMVWAGAPKAMWDDAIEYEAYIQSNTAWDIFMLQGETPETVMSGETSHISQLCEFGFYEWIMFWEDPDHAQFPADNPILGRYLGPACWRYALR